MTTYPTTLPDYTTQLATAYKTAIDSVTAMQNRLAGSFAPHAQSTPDMTVRVDAGVIPKVGATPTEVAAQNTGTITAPSTNPRNDIVYVDAADGTVGVATGAEAASPSDPAVPAGKVAVARITLVVSQTEITNADLDDLRSPLAPPEVEGTAVASASAPDIWAGDGRTVHITGTTTITDFADAPWVGASRWLIFDGALTLTHGSGITLPGTANITTAAGDMAYVYADTVSAFRVAYFKADGTAVAGSAGNLLATSYAEDGAVATGTTTIPNDDTIPQNTEGNQYITVTHNRQSASSNLLIIFNGHFSPDPSAANRVTVALFQDSTANALAVEELRSNDNRTQNVTLVCRISSGATGNTTFKIRAGATAGTITFNGASGARLFGGKFLSTLTVMEVAV